VVDVFDRFRPRFYEVMAKVRPVLKELEPKVPGWGIENFFFIYFSGPFPENGACEGTLGKSACSAPRIRMHRKGEIRRSLAQTFLRLESGGCGKSAGARD